MLNLRGKFYLAFVLVIVQGGNGGLRNKSWVGYCVVPHCDHCKTHTRCEDCEEGYYKENWKCFPCTDFHSECVECSDDGTCTKCAEGFHPSTEGCQKCPEGCASCTSQSVCDICEEEYGKVGDTCVKCEYHAENCSLCLAPPTPGDNVIQNLSLIHI